MSKPIGTVFCHEVGKMAKDGMVYVEYNPAGYGEWITSTCTKWKEGCIKCKFLAEPNQEADEETRPLFE